MPVPARRCISFRLEENVPPQLCSLNISSKRLRLLLIYRLARAGAGHHHPLTGDPRAAWLRPEVQPAHKEEHKDASADHPAGVWP